MKSKSTSLKVLLAALGEYRLEELKTSLEEAVKLFRSEPEAVSDKIRLNYTDYRVNRGQYDAEEILKTVSTQIHLNKGSKLLMVTSEDIFVEGLNFVFGLADIAKGMAIISTYRLYAQTGEYRGFQDLFEERVFKEAAHELGHLFGLTHCPDRRCLMTFSNSIYDVDKKSGRLCSNCRQKAS